MKTFERWMAETTFPDGTMPVNAREKYLMRLAYEANATKPIGNVMRRIEQRPDSVVVKEIPER